MTTQPHTNQLAIEFFPTREWANPEHPGPHLVIQFSNTPQAGEPIHHWIALDNDNVAEFIGQLLDSVMELGREFSRPTLHKLIRFTRDQLGKNLP